jgi:hypothetical protein
MVFILPATAFDAETSSAADHRLLIPKTCGASPLTANYLVILMFNERVVVRVSKASEEVIKGA